MSFDPLLHSGVVFAESLDAGVESDGRIFDCVVAAIYITAVVRAVLPIVKSRRGIRGNLLAGFRPIFAAMGRVFVDIGIFHAVGIGEWIDHVVMSDAFAPESFGAELFVFR